MPTRPATSSSLALVDLSILREEADIAKREKREIEPCQRISF
jgi:hypothetical protein